MSFSHKHLNRRRNLHSKSRIYSTTWSALLGEEVIKNGIKWIATNIKNGISCLSLWFDKWMSEGPLRSLIVRLRNRGEKALLLKDFIQHNHWNWGSISFVIPPEEDKIWDKAWWAQQAHVHGPIKGQAHSLCGAPDRTRAQTCPPRFRFLKTCSTRRRLALQEEDLLCKERTWATRRRLALQG